MSSFNEETMREPIGDMVSNTHQEHNPSSEIMEISVAKRINKELELGETKISEEEEKMVNFTFPSNHVEVCFLSLTIL